MLPLTYLYHKLLPFSATSILFCILISIILILSPNRSWPFLILSAADSQHFPLFLFPPTETVNFSHPPLLLIYLYMLLPPYVIFLYILLRSLLISAFALPRQPCSLRASSSIRSCSLRTSSSTRNFFAPSLNLFYVSPLRSFASQPLAEIYDFFPHPATFPSFPVQLQPPCLAILLELLTNKINQLPLRDI